MNRRGFMVALGLAPLAAAMPLERPDRTTYVRMKNEFVDTINLVDGKITAISIVNNGSGYTSPPVHYNGVELIFDPPSRVV